MSEFWIWFSTGLQHILDWNGYDHILYVIALTVLFTYTEWRKLLVLVTAFTVGHSITLATSTLNLISINSFYIELLIPITIIITCLVNVWVTFKDKSIDDKIAMNYVLALFFGFIHGLGFSYLLKSMLGSQETIVFPLLSFNLGLEVGQLIIVLTVLLLSIFLTRFTTLKKTSIINTISLLTCCVAGFLFFQRLI